MRQKFQRIVDLLEVQTSSLYRLGPERFTYTMIMCLTDEELTEFYFENYSGPLEKQIISRIAKRLEEQGVAGFRSFLNDVLVTMEEVNFNTYQKLRSHFRRFLPFADEELKEHVFKQFIDSHRREDRRIACEAALCIWCVEVEARLWEAWHLWRDEMVLQILMQKSHPVRLLEVVEIVWFESRYSDRIRREFVKLVAAHDFFESRVRRRGKSDYLPVASCAVR